MENFRSHFLSDLKEMQGSILFEPQQPSRILDVHPSALPYCPTSFLLSFDPDLMQQQKFQGQAIMNQGTALHSTMDRFLGRIDRAFGDFVCTDCGCIQHLKQASDFPNMRCPECGGRLHYEEVYIDYKGFVGHVDFLYNTGSKKNPKLWVVDFKSKSYSLTDPTKTDIPLNYHYQTLAYTLLLRAQYGLKIQGRAILNICRDNPSRMVLAGVHKWSKDDLIQGHKDLLEQRELYEFMLNCKSYKEWMDSIGVQRCANQYCNFCKTYEDSEIKSLIRQKFKLFKGKSIREIVEERSSNENHNQQNRTGAAV